MQFHFGGHILNPGRRELRRDGALVPVEPQVFDLIVHLLGNRDKVVSKDDLIESVWGGRSVSDATIDSRVKAARQAIGDSGSAQSVIRTMARKGVRFIADVREEKLSTSNVSVPSAHLTLPDKPSIAVLAFNNMSSDPEQEYFSDGIAEDIITALSRYPSLFVIARNSSFAYKGRATDVKTIGGDLGVRYVLEGSVRKSGERIRVTAQLIEAESGNHLWAERYDRDLADVFLVQDQITTAVTVAIAPAVADAERQRAFRQPPDSLDAWAAYQRGLWHLGKSTISDILSAETFFRRGIELHPNFAASHRGLAWTLVIGASLFQLHDPTQVFQSAEIHARRAVALDGTDAEAHACLSGTLLQHYADYQGARTAAERALAINPNLASAHGELGRTLIFGGSPREGLPAVEMSIRLDPRDPLLALRLNQLAVGHYHCRDYEAASETAQRAIRDYPEHPMPYRWRAAALGQHGTTADARAALAKAIDVNPAAFKMFVQRKVLWHRPEDYAHMMDGLRKAGWAG